MLRTKVIKKCRLCSSKELSFQFSLGNLCVNDFVSYGANVRRAPLEMVKCGRCGLVQLRHTAPQELLYSGFYWYKSAVNPIIANDLEEIVEQALRIAQPKPNDIWLDIGANDGTLFSFVSLRLKKVGCEPAKNLRTELLKHCDILMDCFWNWEDYAALVKRKAKIITAIGMFYDLDNPSQFVADAAQVLDEDGIFVAQLMTLAPMARNNDVSNICHEHLEYYSYQSLVHLFEQAGLEIFRMEENGINGGSYRLFARHYRQGSIKVREGKIDLKKFYQRICRNKEKTVEFIKKVKAKGKEVYGYGASTKGNTILQWYGLTPDLITAIADKNPEKWGKYTVGTNIPIVSEAQARKKADYLLILPWGFTDYFLEREKCWRKKGKFIASIPNFKIL